MRKNNPNQTQELLFKKNQKSGLKTILLTFALINSFGLFFCKEETKESGLIPLSLASIIMAKESEEQDRINQCTGNIPGIACTTVTNQYPTDLRQVELYDSGNRFSQVEVTGVPIIKADCTTYYQINWGNNIPYSSTRLYLKTTDGEICGIGWETQEGKRTTKLLELAGSEKELKSVTEINANGMTLKFYR
ncbi:hypothetical protein EHQ24_03100 [Leptospira noumeaensis]|uniref:Uncharacterized protein n=1 Tax=Leptospira noumeaensis TaxID=2484964 RepID=A0A4R9IHF9_9LEPT|nr:hypothetical protein [Leptospira noumeaensis]TGK87533.1 hypothetical protein EHQ24_03100 [Leptospira noumeaensis]